MLCTVNYPGNKLRTHILVLVVRALTIFTLSAKEIQGLVTRYYVFSFCIVSLSAVSATGFVAINMTIQNTAGPSMGQAVALRNAADLSASRPSIDAALMGTKTPC